MSWRPCWHDSAEVVARWPPTSPCSRSRPIRPACGSSLPSGRCGRRPSSSRPEGNRTQAAVRRATATVGRPSWGIRSFRRGPPWCRSRPTPRGSWGCKASRCRMSACGCSNRATTRPGRSAWPSGEARCLFAHFGVTGPAALDVSRAISGHAAAAAARVAVRSAARSQGRGVGGRVPGGMSRGRPAIGRGHRRPLRAATSGRDDRRPGGSRSRASRGRGFAQRAAAAGCLAQTVRYPGQRHLGLQQGGSHCRRRRLGRGRFAHDGKPARAGAVLCRRDPGHRRSDRRLQFSGRLQHRWLAGESV